MFQHCLEMCVPIQNDQLHNKADPLHAQNVVPVQTTSNCGVVWTPCLEDKDAQGSYVVCPASLKSAQQDAQADATA